MAIKALNIQAGQIGVLPKNVPIIGLILDGATATSSCGALPDPVSRVCYKLKWEFDSDDFFKSLTVGGNTFLIPSVVGISGLPSAQILSDWINTTDVLKDLCIAHCPTTIGSKGEVFLAIPDSLPAPELTVTNGISTGNWDYFVRGIIDTSCQTCP